jgi:uncharacterized membrane protein
VPPTKRAAKTKNQGEVGATVMAERKSAVREVEVEIDDSARTRKERLQLGALGVGGLAIIALMFLISSFLSKKDTAHQVSFAAIFGVLGLICALMLVVAHRIGVAKKA